MKFPVLTVSAFALVSLSSGSFAASLFSESFNYANGGISGLNGGTGFSGAYTGVGDVTTPGLQYTTGGQTGGKLTTASNNGGAFRDLSTAIDTNNAVVWLGFLMATNGTVPNYAGLSFFNAGTEEIFLGKPSNTSNYGFDISGVNTQSAPAAPATSATSFLLYKLTFTSAGDTLDFFANSVPGVEPTTPTFSFTAPEGSYNSTLNRIRLQSGDQSVTFDEIRAGTTYADAIPEPTTSVLLGFAGLALGAVRRRSTAQA